MKFNLELSKTAIFLTYLLWLQNEHKEEYVENVNVPLKHNE